MQTMFRRLTRHSLHQAMPVVAAFARLFKRPQLAAGATGRGHDASACAPFSSRRVSVSTATADFKLGVGNVRRPIPQLISSVVVGDPAVVASPTSNLLHTPGVTTFEKLDALGQLTTPPLTLYHTTAHVALMEFLLRHVSRLSVAGFGRNGTHARTILGAKGIGKSTLLMQFVKVAGALFPNVIPVYVSYSEPRHDDLMVTVVQELVARDVMDADWASRVPDIELVSLVLGALKEKGKRLLLVVDEADQLYRVDHAKLPVEAKAANKTLGRLAALGDRGGHWTAVLLCGSSSVLPLLITANGTRDAGIRAEYPGVVGAPNLNGTKFSEFRLVAGLPNDLRTAKAVCEGHRVGGDPPADEGTARLALFVAGSTPRYLEKAWTNGFSSLVIAADASSSTLTLSGRSQMLYTAVIHELCRVNESWMRTMVDSDRVVLPDVVARYHWEDKLVPLNWKQLATLWSRVCEQTPDSPSIGPMETQLQSELLRLCDKSFLASDHSNT
jgi:hypothetical protein